MRPNLIVVNSSWEKKFLLRVARHTIINFNKAFLSLKSDLYPVFSSWRDDWTSVLLRVDTLPDRFFGINVSDRAIFDKLELRGYPLGIDRHQETHVHVVFNWYL